MNDDVFSTLANVQNDFLFSLESGQQGIASFFSRWSSICSTLTHKSGKDPRDARTRDQALCAARDIEVLAATFLDLERNLATTSVNLTSEIDQVLDGIMDSSVDLHPPQPSFCIPDHIHEDSDPLSSYAPKAYKWLLENLHDPYPCPETKASMSAESGLPLKTINTWFTNARRRFGWSRISKQYFRGNRVDTAAFAQRVLLEGQSSSSLDNDSSPRLKIVEGFLHMKQAVEKTYHRKYEETESVKRLTQASTNSCTSESPPQKPLEKPYHVSSSICRRINQSRSLDAAPFDPNPRTETRRISTCSSDSSISSLASSRTTPIPMVPQSGNILDNSLSGLSDGSSGTELFNFEGSPQFPVTNYFQSPSLSPIPPHSRKRRLSHCREEEIERRPPGAKRVRYIPSAPNLDCQTVFNSLPPTRKVERDHVCIASPPSSPSTPLTPTSNSWQDLLSVASCHTMPNDKSFELPVDSLTVVTLASKQPNPPSRTSGCFEDSSPVGKSLPDRIGAIEKHLGTFSGEFSTGPLRTPIVSPSRTKNGYERSLSESADNDAPAKSFDDFPLSSFDFLYDPSGNLPLIDREQCSFSFGLPFNVDYPRCEMDALDPSSHLFTPDIDSLYDYYLLPEL